MIDARMLKVVCEDLMCFLAYPSGRPATTERYDPWAWTDPQPQYKTISSTEWRSIVMRKAATRSDDE